MNEDVQSTEPACCGGGDFFGHEPYCDCGHVLAEKATADRLTKLEAVASAAARLVLVRVAGCLCCNPEACDACPPCPKCETEKALSAL